MTAHTPAKDIAVPQSDLPQPLEYTELDNPQACVSSSNPNDPDIDCTAIHGGAEAIEPPPRMIGIIMDTTGDGPSMEIKIDVTGRHPTLGMTFSTEPGKSLVLLKCNPGTPSARIPKWRNHLRNAQCREIDGVTVMTMAHVKKAISQARTSGKKDISLVFSTEKFASMNPQEGVPQIHYDQMNVIAASHHAARTGEEYYQRVETVPPSDSPHVMRAAVPGLNDKRKPYS